MPFYENNSDILAPPILFPPIYRHRPIKKKKNFHFYGIRKYLNFTGVMSMIYHITIVV
jgi:hypothetical protein